jgi:hypothetical protein
MKHFFELPGTFSDKIVIVEYSITHIIEKDFQDRYNAAVSDVMKADAAVDEALEKLSTADDNGIKALATAGHKNAVERLEAARRVILEMDISPVALAVRKDTINITIANLKGHQAVSDVWDVRCQLPYSQLQRINQEVEQLQERIAGSTTPFRETLDY